MRACSLVVLTTLSIGCRTYTPVGVQEVAPGGSARVRLTDRGMVDLASLIGPRGELVEGHVVSQDDSLVVLAVSTVTRTNGVEDPWNGERVPIPTTAVSNVDVPKLSRGRSFLLAGGILFAALAVAAGMGAGEAIWGGGEGGGGSGQQ